MAAFPVGGEIVNMTESLRRWRWMLPLLGACVAAVAAQPAAVPQEAATAALQATRGSADPRVHRRAEQELARLVTADPENPRALALQAWLEMSRHRFAAALGFAGRALAADPAEPIALALRVDALTELGRYDEAIEAAQVLAGRAPPVVVYPRIAHLRFLHGDLEGAIEMARRALAHVPAGHADRRWLTGDLGRLLIEDGRAQAAVELLRALPPATAEEHAWLARALRAAGESAAAAEHWRLAHGLAPAAEYALALWELARERGDARERTRYARLLAGQARLDALQGGLSNREFIEFHGLDGNLPAAHELARAEWARRPDIFSAAQLAWVLRRMGRDAEADGYQRVATRLGTRSRDLAKWRVADMPADRSVPRLEQAAQ